MRNTFQAQHFFAEYLRQTIESNDVGTIDVLEWQPAESEYHSDHPNTIFIYFSDVNMESGKVSQMDPQQISPFLNLDIYVSAPATEDNGVFSKSNFNAHRVAEGIVEFCYATLMHQTTRDEAENQLGFKLATIFVRSVQAIGDVKKIETARATIGFRLRFEIGLEERNDGYNGKELKDIVDKIIT